MFAIIENCAPSNENKVGRVVILFRRRRSHRPVNARVRCFDLITLSLHRILGNEIVATNRDAGLHAFANGLLCLLWRDLAPIIREVVQDFEFRFDL